VRPLSRGEAPPGVLHHEEGEEPPPAVVVVLRQGEVRPRLQIPLRIVLTKPGQEIGVLFRQVGAGSEQSNTEHWNHDRLLITTDSMIRRVIRSNCRYDDSHDLHAPRRGYSGPHSPRRPPRRLLLRAAPRARGLGPGAGAHRADAP